MTNSVGALVEGSIDTSHPFLLRASKLEMGSGANGTRETRQFGYLRIFSFSHACDGGAEDRFVEEVQRLMGLMAREAPDGLIVDIRDNPGGNIRAAERMLQFMAAHRIEPARFEFLATEPVLQLVERNQAIWGGWLESLREARTTGSLYSRSFPITDPVIGNEVGQLYHGPVVLITSAESYSAADIFAAGFVDNEIGKILGVDESTGGGGANVIQQSVLLGLARAGASDKSAAAGPLALEELPEGVQIRLALRRAIRVKAQAGMILEDLGVKSKVRHYLTRDDLLYRNRNLLQAAAKLLWPQPRRRLEVSVQKVREDGLDIEVMVSSDVERLTRINLYLNDQPLRFRNDPRPVVSFKNLPVDGVLRLELFAEPARQNLGPESFTEAASVAGVLVASRREDLGELARRANR